MYIFNAVANLVPRVLSYLPYGARERERDFRKEPWERGYSPV